MRRFSKVRYTLSFSHLKYFILFLIFFTMNDPVLRLSNVSVSNIIRVINASAKRGELNYQEAQLLRSLILVEYGKFMKKDLHANFYREIQVQDIASTNQESLQTRSPTSLSTKKTLLRDTSANALSSTLPSLSQTFIPPQPSIMNLNSLFSGKSSSSFKLDQ